jgi:GT2 family glycosyltransferase
MTAPSTSRLVRHGPAGSVASRNRGVREASAPVVMFLDDDCEPTLAWARLLLSELEAGAPVAAGRCVNPDRSDVLGEATQVVLDFLTLRSLDGDRTAFAPTYNLACRRDLALELPFEERYENSGADRDWCARLSARGDFIRFVPSARVVHRQTLDLPGFLLKHYRYGRGSCRFRRRHSLSLEAPGFYADLVRSGLARGVLVGSAVSVAQAATAVGYVAERLSTNDLPSPPGPAAALPPAPRRDPATRESLRPRR